MTTLEYILIAIAVLPAVPAALYGLTFYALGAIALGHMLWSFFSEAFFGGRKW